MKRILSLLIMISLLCGVSIINAQAFVPAQTDGPQIAFSTNIEDGEVLRIGITSDNNNLWIDLNGNHSFDEGEQIHLSDKIQTEQDLYMYSLSSGTKDVTIYGAVKDLAISHNKITKIDLKKSTDIESLNASYNELTNISIDSEFEKLQELNIGHNQIASIRSIGILPGLKIFDCSDNKISVIHPSNFKSLEELYCENNRISQYLLFDSTPKIRIIHCFGNHITDKDGQKNMTMLIKSLPYRLNNIPGMIVIQDPSKSNNNQLTPAKVYLLDQRNWNTYLMDSSKNNIPEEYPHYEVSIEKGKGGIVKFLSQNYFGNKQNFPKGFTFSLMAKEIRGFHLKQLLAGDKDITPANAAYVQGSTQEERTFNVYDVVTDQKMVIKGVFEKNKYKIASEIKGEGTLEYYDVSDPNNPQKITDLNHIDYLTKIKVVAQPKRGWHTFSLTENYGQDIQKNPTFDVRYDELIQVEFRRDRLKVDVEVNGEGAAELDFPVNLLDQVEAGTIIKITKIEPQKYWRLASIIAADKDITESKQFLVNDNMKLIFNFEHIYYQLTFDYDRNAGSISIDKNLTTDHIEAGTKVQVQVKANEGYELESLTANGMDIKDDKTFVMEDNTILKATFKKASDINQLPKTNNLIEVYPNPTTEIVYINGGSEMVGQKAMLFDINGRLINSITLRSQKEILHIEQPDGLYILKIGNRTIKITKKQF